jgi:hypothetical protein
MFPEGKHIPRPRATVLLRAEGIEASNNGEADMPRYGFISV